MQNTVYHSDVITTVLVNSVYLSATKANYWNQIDVGGKCVPWQQNKVLCKTKLPPYFCHVMFIAIYKTIMTIVVKNYNELYWYFHNFYNMQKPVLKLLMYETIIIIKLPVFKNIRQNTMILTNESVSYLIWFPKIIHRTFANMANKPHFVEAAMLAQNLDKD